MISKAEIRKQLIRMLSEEIDLDAFEDWLVQHSWNIHRSGDVQAERLAYAIELKLAEHSSGHLPAKDLRNELLMLANPYYASVADIQTGATSSPPEEVRWSVLSADIQPLAAF